MSLLVATAVGVFAGPLPTGPGLTLVGTGAGPLALFTFRPVGYDPAAGPLLIVCHGVNRDADVYRDSARPLAEAVGGLVVAPRFDKPRFPTAAYQQGNLRTADGGVTPPAARTWARLPEVVAAVRARAGRPGQPVVLLGHSGGGQFLCRLAGFFDSGAVRIVAANPGTLLFPTRDLPYPYGFGGLPTDLSDDAALRRYLAAPLTLLLGTADRVADKNLDVSPTALKQGASRFDRGRACFALARELASARGWPLGWRLVEADGVGHSGAKMFAHPACRRAISSD